MKSVRRLRRYGLTLIEVLVTIAIIGILMGILLSAIQAARKAAQTAACKTKMRELGVAVNNYHGQRGRLPTYFGVDNSDDTTYPWVDRKLVYGSWFVHLLPYIEQDSVYGFAQADCQANNWNEWHYTDDPTSSVWVVDISIVTFNGGHSYVNGGYWWPPRPAQNDGIWLPEVANATFPILNCPADPTADGGKAYGYWGSTNYLANFNAWAIPDNGVWSPPSNFNRIIDGLAQTVMFGEGYANCDGIGRIALYSWFYHNFGIDWDQQPDQLMFQINPAPADCDSWRTQSGHYGGMNVCMFDASVRTIHQMSQATWSAALLPRDGQVPGSDW